MTFLGMVDQVLIPRFFPQFPAVPDAPTAMNQVLSEAIQVTLLADYLSGFFPICNIELIFFRTVSNKMLFWIMFVLVFPCNSVLIGNRSFQRADKRRSVQGDFLNLPSVRVKSAPSWTRAKTLTQQFQYQCLAGSIAQPSPAPQGPFPLHVLQQQLMFPALYTFLRHFPGRVWALSCPSDTRHKD